MHIRCRNCQGASGFHSILFFAALILLGCSLLSPLSTSAQRLPATPNPRATPLAVAHSAIQRIRDRDNTLIAGVKYDFEPFGFIDNSGNLVGFDVDLVRAIADLWGVNVQFVQVNSSNRLQFLTTGAVDLIAASLTHTKEREAIVDFSQTYYLDGQRLLVRGETGITDIDSLAGKTVAAIQGSTALDNIRDLVQKNKLQVTVLPFQEYPPALAALKAGQVDALTTDNTYLARAAQNNPGLHVVGDFFSTEQYGIGVQADDSYFRDLINFTLQALKANGAYDRIYTKWFPGTAPYPIEILPGQWPYTFATSPTQLDRPAQTRLALIRARGKLLVGVKYDFPPFGSVNAQGTVQGFDVDIAREFAKRWLGSADAVELVPVISDTRIPFLSTGAVDLVVASMTHTQQRDDLIDFSETYFLDGQSLLVQKTSGIEELKDLNGKTVAAVTGSTALENIMAISKERAIKITVLPFQEYPSAVEALKAGQVDAVTTDSMALAQFAKDNPTLIVVGTPFTQEPYGIGVPRFDSAFRDQVNLTLQAMQLDGTYTALYEKWFGKAFPYPIELWPSVGPALTQSPTSAVAINPPTTLPVATRRPSATPTTLRVTPAAPSPTQQLILIPSATPTLPSTPVPTNANPIILLPTNTPIPSENPTPMRHTIAQGETLSTIALRYYGSSTLWTRIYEANRDKIGDDPNNLVLGMELVIPPNE
ncbi:MAG: transporter substrate-binding domain-containing protein [Chloroflexi bacterium]|nr:transporter substrate-binding domain-containing protein [Chloroflexota bacterium]